jgi:hypothetical protein
MIAIYQASVGDLRNVMGETRLRQRRPKAPRCPPTKRLPMLNLAGERKRPTTGWASLTPTERDVVRLVSEGAGQQGHRHPTVRLASNCADPPDPRLHQTRPDIPRPTRPRSSAPTPRLTHNRAKRARTYLCREAAFDRPACDRCVKTIQPGCPRTWPCRSVSDYSLPRSDRCASPAFSATAGSGLILQAGLPLVP